MAQIIFNAALRQSRLPHVIDESRRLRGANNGNIAAGLGIADGGFKERDKRIQHLRRHASDLLVLRADLGGQIKDGASQDPPGSIEMGALALHDKINVVEDSAHGLVFASENVA